MNFLAIFYSKSLFERVNSKDQRFEKKAKSSLSGYTNFGGIDEVLNNICEIIEYPLFYPEVYEWLGVTPTNGVLLYGPPGCGKTALVHAIANECRIPLLQISAPEVVVGISGESEKKIRSLFSDALALAPSILFIDEIETITAKRENTQRETEKRIVAQIMTCMDELRTSEMKDTKALSYSGHVIVIGATNHPEWIDPALRRAGRFDREIKLGLPTESARNDILKAICQNLRLEDRFDYNSLAKHTPGFVGADLVALTKEAATLAIKRTIGNFKRNKFLSDDNQFISNSELSKICILRTDFDKALPKVQPSIKRDGFSSIPDVTWGDVGYLEEIRAELDFSISRSIHYSNFYEKMGLPNASGVLLHGPPGCGKTLLAKAIANESAACFICVKGPELLNKYVGESERAVRALFSRGMAAAPCMLFFDEIDSLASKRIGSDNQVTERVVNQLLSEMDGIDSRKGLYIVAATNRPDMIDPALMRPGRLDKILYVPLPSPNGRASILKTQGKMIRIAPDVDLEDIALLRQLEGSNGADLKALIQSACIISTKEYFAQLENHINHKRNVELPVVQLWHFKIALHSFNPSSCTINKLNN